ncbi:MAG: hypothetical protein AAF772_08110, partial [Acidobacteriota bacterium]
EGELDLRLSRMIKDAFFEGQIKYRFVSGDLSAFLRYRYYGYKRVYEFSVFDTVEFEDLEDFDNDFERVRGYLGFITWPFDQHHRTFLLAQVDRLSTSKEELRFTANRTNTFVRFGFQRGTPNDSRSNAIVGNTRARVDRLFTAHRKIGPGQMGFTTALTYGFDFLGGDFDYLSLRIEALKRVDVGPRMFVVGRLRAGSFLFKEEIRDDVVAPFVGDRFAVPRNELFKLGGRENLKGVDNDIRGTELALTTVEWFIPWFESDARRFLGLTWNSVHWVLYAGLGTAGFDKDVYADWDRYFPDFGGGLEASFQLKDYTFFLSAVVAGSSRNDIEDVEAHFSIKSYH